jgi:hypothetical protein
MRAVGPVYELREGLFLYEEVVQYTTGAVEKSPPATLLE